MNDDLLPPLPVSSTPPKIHPKAVRVFIHDYDKARKQAAKNKTVPVLQFKDGAEHVLLPTGQHVRKDEKDRHVSGKARRRERIRMNRLARSE